MSNIVLSIKPEFVKQIISGKKTVELRKKAPRSGAYRARVFIWETSPSKQMAGIATIASITVLPIRELWKEVQDIAGVTQQQFDDYFKDHDLGFALYLEDIQEFTVKPKLELLRILLQFYPPQNFCYMSVKQTDRLLELTKDVTTTPKCSRCNQEMELGIRYRDNGRWKIVVAKRSLADKDAMDHCKRKLGGRTGWFCLCFLQRTANAPVVQPSNIMDDGLPFDLDQTETYMEPS